jgi:hypothetical protein
MENPDPDLLRQIGAAIAESVAERRALAALAVSTIRALVTRGVLLPEEAQEVVDAAAEMAELAGGSVALLQELRAIVADPGE